ncbi:hypothetical protein FB157_10399 [Streptomyces sp. BK340]|nr:hypothetical protein FB157_10399 [Streptomyces sp. BK340]
MRHARYAAPGTARRASAGQQPAGGQRPALACAPLRWACGPVVLPGHARWAPSPARSRGRTVLSRPPSGPSSAAARGLGSRRSDRARSDRPPASMRRPPDTGAERRTPGLKSPASRGRSALYGAAVRGRSAVIVGPIGPGVADCGTGMLSCDRPGAATDHRVPLSAATSPRVQAGAGAARSRSGHRPARCLCQGHGRTIVRRAPVPACVSVPGRPARRSLRGRGGRTAPAVSAPDDTDDADDAEALEADRRLPRRAGAPEHPNSGRRSRRCAPGSAPACRSAPPDPTPSSEGNSVNHADIWDRHGECRCSAMTFARMFYQPMVAALAGPSDSWSPCRRAAGSAGQGGCMGPPR